MPCARRHRVGAALYEPVASYWSGTAGNDAFAANGILVLGGNIQNRPDFADALVLIRLATLNIGFVGIQRGSV